MDLMSSTIPFGTPDMRTKLYEFFKRGDNISRTLQVMCGVSVGELIKSKQVLYFKYLSQKKNHREMVL